MTFAINQATVFYADMPLFNVNCLLFIFLALTTLVLHTQIDQYEPIGTDILDGDWKYRPARSNHVEISGNTLTLYSDDANTGISVQHDLFPVKPGTLILVSAEVKCINVVPGKNTWSLARILFAQNDGKSDQWQLPHTVVKLTGDHDWKTYQTAFLIDEDTQSIKLYAQISQSTGLLKIRNIRVFPVLENEIYPTVKKIILTAWGGFFLLLAGSLLFAHQKNIVLRVTLLVPLISILAGTTVPSDIKISLLDEVKTQIHAESDTFKEMIPWDLDKVGHVFFFFLLGLIIRVTMADGSIFQIIAVVLMLAAGTEITQLYIEGRTPLPSDFYIDIAGAAAGIVLASLLGFIGGKVFAARK
ncbi:VanZ family protein [Nitrosomonas sp.]|uniref:VanZ family protein n=1 Tax=Nitrosomonas sp. TaxID=42353 RepID=UPI001DC6161F|nr:VanZ family protein [Nitrosomonas sp.]MBX3617147.1 VanZ family protein [Nitrosomonas sp.]